MLLAYEIAEREENPELRKMLLTFVIVGGGPTGVEMAGAIAEIARQTLADEFRSIRTDQARVLLIEAGPSILPAFPKRLRDAARKSLTKLGVEVREKTTVTKVEEGRRLARAPSAIDAGTVIWAAGVTASPLGKIAGRADRQGWPRARPARSVDPRASGSVRRRRPRRFEGSQGQQYPGVAQVAMQQANSAAGAIVRTIKGQTRKPFKYRNLGNMATIGRNAAIADLNWLRASGFAAWVLWLTIHIFWLIGFRNRLTVLVQWAGAYLTYPAKRAADYRRCRAPPIRSRPAPASSGALASCNPATNPLNLINPINLDLARSYAL